jgi:hypothetical protein
MNQPSQHEVSLTTPAGVTFVLSGKRAPAAVGLDLAQAAIRILQK